MFQVFLNRCPVQVRPFPPTAALHPSVQVLRPVCRGNRCTGGTRADKHTCTLTVALGFLRHLWLPNSHPLRTLFEAVHGRRGTVHSHSPMQGPLTPSMSFASSLSVFYCHPVSFPFLFFLLSALDFSISQTVPFAVPPFLAQSSVFLSLPHSCLDVRPFQTECFLSVCCQAKGHCPLGL